MHIKRIYSLILGISLYVSGLKAQGFKQQIGFRSDNDSYLANGQDRYYTNGLFISYRETVNKGRLKSDMEKKILELELGQKMYNAQSGAIPSIIYVDRPITAYLFAGAGMEWFYKTENILKISAQIGTIGPNALGQEAQEFIHRITGLYTPEGWEYQLKNELGLNTQIAYSSLIQRNKTQNLDLLWHGYANLGTTFTGAGIGFTMRYGKLNQLFQSAYKRSLIGTNNQTQKINQSEFFFFAKPQLEFIAHDASVSGGLFRQDKGPVTYQPKPWVLSQEMGLMLAKNRFIAQLSYTFKTAEIKSNARPHQYGTIGTYYLFN